LIQGSGPGRNGESAFDVPLDDPVAAAEDLQELMVAELVEPPGLEPADQPAERAH
jgi:hypothetical protein